MPTDSARRLIEALHPWPMFLNDAWEVAEEALSEEWERGYRFGTQVPHND